MDILTVDFETYYDQQYSLSKMTTEEYIRDSRFETIGVCVKKNDGYGVWYSGTKADTKRFLDRYDWANSVAVAHNAVFDMAILNWVYDIRPKKIVDTLSMARARGHASVSLARLAEEYGLGAKGTEVVKALGKRRHDFMGPDLQQYGNYCRNDVELTYELFKRLGDGFPVAEFKLIDLTIRMFTEPVLRLNEINLRKHLYQVKETKQRLLDSIGLDTSSLMSNAMLAECLRRRGVEPPMKKSLTTGKDTYAFAKSDEAFVALLEHEDVLVQALVTARLGVKSTLEESRTERFIGISLRGTCPIPLRYYAAHTGRWGGDDKVNMQNLPRGSLLKKCILPPVGYTFIDSDSSQIEARMLAWLAGQDDLVLAFENGEDVYCIMASAIYGRTITKADALQRFVGKTTILGCGYGMGGAKFQNTLRNATPSVRLELDECTRTIQTYRATYPMIPALWKDGQTALRAIANDQYYEFGRGGILKVEGRKGIRLPNGLYLSYPNLRWETDEGGNDGFVYDSIRGRASKTTRIYGGKVIENVCQALARIVIGEQMLRVARKYRVVMTVHDAIGVVVPDEEAERAKEYVEICMRLRPSWAMELPLNCEAGSGPSYGECK